jgi:hypothetical protein
VARATQQPGGDKRRGRKKVRSSRRRPRRAVTTFRISVEGLRRVLAGSDRCCWSSGSASKRWLAVQASGSQVRLQGVAIRPGSKHAGDSCNPRQSRARCEATGRRASRRRAGSRDWRGAGPRARRARRPASVMARYRRVRGGTQHPSPGPSGRRVAGSRRRWHPDRGMCCVSPSTGEVGWLSIPRDVVEELGGRVRARRLRRSRSSCLEARGRRRRSL